MADGNLLRELVVRAQGGDLEAFGRLVRKTQAKAYAVAKGVLRDRGLAEDAAQEAFLRAYQRLRDLDEPRGFGAWLRRIVITVALNMRRARRHTFLRLDDVPEVPVLDEEETTWSDIQRQRLARALLMLTDDERRLCDRRYHGQWSTSRLAREAGVEEAVIRKRLQRVRDKLRKEILRSIPPWALDMAWSASRCCAMASTTSERSTSPVWRSPRVATTALPIPSRPSTRACSSSGFTAARFG
jgi:RNA polymerase sigma factor (sigma-70 family)